MSRPEGRKRKKKESQAHQGCLCMIGSVETVSGELSYRLTPSRLGGIIPIDEHVSGVGLASQWIHHGPMGDAKDDMMTQVRRISETGMTD